MAPFRRFKDLKEKGIVGNRATLARLIANENFPPGFLISPNVRVWPDQEVDAWLARRSQTHIEKVKPRAPKKVVEAHS